jgi:hypothetical protein
MLRGLLVSGQFEVHPGDPSPKVSTDINGVAIEACNHFAPAMTKKSSQKLQTPIRSKSGVLGCNFNNAKIPTWRLGLALPL